MGKHGWPGHEIRFETEEGVEAFNVTISHNPEIGLSQLAGTIFHHLGGDVTATYVNALADAGNEEAVEFREEAKANAEAQEIEEDNTDEIANTTEEN